jgi:hypothetical protein
MNMEGLKKIILSLGLPGRMIRRILFYFGHLDIHPVHIQFSLGHFASPRRSQNLVLRFSSLITNSVGETGSISTFG